MYMRYLGACLRCLNVNRQEASSFYQLTLSKPVALSYLESNRRKVCPITFQQFVSFSFFSFRAGLPFLNVCYGLLICEINPINSTNLGSSLSKVLLARFVKFFCCLTWVKYFFFGLKMVPKFNIGLRIYWTINDQKMKKVIIYRNGDPLAERLRIKKKKKRLQSFFLLTIPSRHLWSCRISRCS